MRIILLFLLGLLGFWQAPAQSSSGIIDALRAGDATELNNYLGNSVEITFENKIADYDKRQANQFFTTFFSNNKVRSFRMAHQSESATTFYFIGSLVTSGGNYRITLFAKEANGKVTLQEIKIEK